MVCSGADSRNGTAIEVRFAQKIESVRTVPVADTQRFIAPGFVDVQVNGFAGVDFNNPLVTQRELGLALDAVLATGVTKCLPTVITGAPEDMLACLRNLRTAQRELPRRRAIAGFHVEGPHIGADDGPRGAHPLRWVREPDIEEYKRWQAATEGNIRIVTVSPHWPGAPAYIAAMVKDGVTASIGHTGASADEIAAAVDAGAAMSTHLGNGAHQLLKRHPNYIWEQMAEDRLTAGFIVDGIHLGPAFLKTALRAKGVERSVLVTDAAAPAGAKPGRYRLGEQEVDLTPDDRVVLAGQDRLAGSALRMNRGVELLMKIGGLTMADAVRLATVNPARIIHLAGRMEGLAAGELGDIVAFRSTRGSVEIEAVFLEGEQVI